MKKFFITFAVFLLAVPLSANALKLGYVDMGILLRDAPQVNSINERLRDKFEKRREDVINMGKEIQDKAGEIKRNELLMTESKLKESKQALEGKYKAYKEKEAALAREMQQVRNDELGNFRDTITAIITKIAKKNNYDLVIKDGVMYADPKLNITKQVLADLKKMHASEQKKASSKK